MPLLHEFFDQYWRQWATRIAVDVPPGCERPTRRQLTYAELAAQSAGITRRLGPLVTRESLVVLSLPRTSGWAYAAQLGVLRAGGAYTSVDPSWPDERVRVVLADAQPSAIITDQAGARRVRNMGVEDARIINVEDQAWRRGGVGTWRHGESDPGTTAPPWLTPETLAYLIYTSGTTGRPKGVMIEHRAIANLVASDLAEFGLSGTDRVGHGSSHAYDSSLEEIWLAWAAGGTVVVLDDDAVRLGLDLVPWLARERVSVLCPPPTLLWTMGGSEAAARLPDLRLLYVGGEPLPPDVAAVWSVGRRLVNGYGPTECAVTSLRAEIRNADAITIGRPVQGLDAWVLDGALEELPDGVAGELCIGGVGLARGYWRAPEMTAAKFPHHPRLGRMYRTGDRAHRDTAGLFFYHGRIDAQVKLRGHRIELEEIETHLARCAGVRAAACRVEARDARQTLVAFVVPSNPDDPPALADLRGALRRALPDHMFPGRMHLVATLPTTIGGKLDRAALPDIDAGLERDDSTFVAPAGEAETIIDGAMRRVLSHPGPVSAADDFFADLGGDSLRAAELVTALRQDPATQSMTVRDVYEAPTIRGMAARAVPSRASDTPADRSPLTRGRPLLVTAIQAVWIVGEVSLAAILSYVVVLDWLPRAMLAIGLVPFLLIAPVLLAAAVAAYAVAALAVVIVTKRLLIGRYAPVEAPVWGALHIRHWIVQQTARLVPWALIAGGEFQSMALRALGARIGRRVHIHRGVDLTQGGWDLLQIGDDVTIGQDAELRLVEFDAGRLVVGPIVMGAGVTLETRAGVDAHARLEAGSYLTAHSSLPPGHTIPAGERWDGIPARPAGPAPETPVPTRRGRAITPLQYSAALVFANVALAAIIGLPVTLAALALAALDGSDAPAVASWIASPRWHLFSLAMIGALAIAAGPITLVWEALIVRAMGRVTPEVISRWSLDYLRV